MDTLDHRYSVAQVTESGQLRQYHELRTRLYLDKGFIDATDLVDGIDVDRFDAVSLHAAAYENGSTDPIGTVRLIPGDLIELPITSTFGIDVGAKDFEVSRLTVDPAHRRSPAMLALIDWVIATLLQHETNQAYGIAEVPFFRFLRALGLPFEQVGEPRRTYNTDNVPIRASVAALIDGVIAADRRRNLPLAPHFVRSMSWAEK